MAKGICSAPTEHRPSGRASGRERVKRFSAYVSNRGSDELCLPTQMGDNALMTEARSQRGGVKPSFRCACAWALASSRRSRTSRVGCLGTGTPALRRRAIVKRPSGTAAGNGRRPFKVSQGHSRLLKPIQAYSRVCRKKNLRRFASLNLQLSTFTTSHVVQPSTLDRQPHYSLCQAKSG
jgi:hypothetical protein